MIWNTKQQQFLQIQYHVSNYLSQKQVMVNK